MSDLIGKIIVADDGSTVYLFRLHQKHIDSGLFELENYEFREAEEQLKHVWWQSYDVLASEFDNDMGLLLTKKQYNSILKCTKDTLGVE